MGEIKSALLQEFRSLVHALSPYRESFVVVGGIVPLLYRYHDDFEPPRHDAQLTTDIDFAVPGKVKVVGQTTMRERLNEGGFVILPSRGSEPPKHIIQNRSYGEDVRGEIYAEFLAPLRGKEIRRDGSLKSPIEVQKGLNAEALRHIEILLECPIDFRLDTLPFEDPCELEVRIPSAAAYIVQKLLCSDRRATHSKRIKDLVSVYDVVLLTNHRWVEVMAETRLLESKFPGPVKDANRILKSAFGEQGVCDSVALVCGADGTSVRRVMRLFLDT